MCLWEKQIILQSFHTQRVFEGSSPFPVAVFIRYKIVNCGGFGVVCDEVTPEVTKIAGFMMALSHTGVSDGIAMTGRTPSPALVEAFTKAKEPFAFVAQNCVALPCAGVRA